MEQVASTAVVGAVAVVVVGTVPLIAAFWTLPRVWRASQVALALAAEAVFSSGVRTTAFRGDRPKSASVSIWPAKAARKLASLVRPPGGEPSRAADAC